MLCSKRILLWGILLCTAIHNIMAGDFLWFNGKTPVTVYIEDSRNSAIQKAFEMFSDDIKFVTGLPALKAMRKNATIVVTFLPPQPSILPSTSSGQAQPSNDSFHLYVKGKQIIIEASNGRGGAYGLLELSRMAGVSPWVWWGDVTPQKKKQLIVPDDLNISHTASVEYRGVFINDEDFALRQWSTKTFDKGSKVQPGLNTYREIFKLLLRLRANTIWPAMHPGSTAFFKIPGAKELADSFGIVVGTSHCEPMLCNNVGEWDEKKFGRFNYVTNKKQVQKYWRKRIETSSFDTNLFTIGMRGIHDSNMEGVGKDIKDQRKWLQKVINDQREMLAKYVNPAMTQIPQVFVPYKEVLYILENGLKVPDDVMLMWCDDNYGYLTRMPDSLQQQRSGGHGIYYHLSYWGRPHDYLWLTTTQPGLIYNELNEAWNHNIRREWIVNIHDPKVASYNLEYFLEMAWNFEQFKANNLTTHLQKWLCRDFGNSIGIQLTPILEEHFRLCSLRKPEFMGWCQTELDKDLYKNGRSPVAVPDWSETECDKFINSYTLLSQKVSQIEKLIPSSLSDAYFATIKYPVCATAAQAIKRIENFRDFSKSSAAHNEIIRLTDKYNHLSGGKWQWIMNCNVKEMPVFAEPAPTTQTLHPIHYKVEQNYTSSDARCSFNPQPVEMLGHTSKALPIPKGEELSFTIEIPESGKYTISTAMIPTQCSDRGDIRFSVVVCNDSDTDSHSKTFSLKEPFRSEGWKQNVLNGQAVKSFDIELEKGTKIIKIKALDEHIIFDELNVLM
ncbi:MAG: glycosyl hydrolase 115 family protein [Prevotellaceae bacterium]|nr:glycosyl hydrolase 115 family protein [Prevotellaceae bacterium]